VNERLEELKREFEKGKQRLDALDRERQDVRDTLLRIGGAIQILEELSPKPIVPPDQSAHAAARM
jgi:hypothetical protein